MFAIEGNGAVRDEVLLVNGIAYVEGDLKLAHLRILLTIVAGLQRLIQNKISRAAGVPSEEEPLPHVVTLPLSAFPSLTKNGTRLRTYLEELKSVPLVFPDPSIPCRCARITHRFPGLIEGYCFPLFAHSVDIYLTEDMAARLLLTEEGYAAVSRSSSLAITNKYTVRIYWLISSWRSKGGFILSLRGFRRMLCLGSAYGRYDNIVGKILEPARKDLESRFPIWFQYRLERVKGEHAIVFKIHLKVDPERRMADMRAAWDTCFRYLSSVGANVSTIQEVFARLEYEDLRPFLAKIVSLCDQILSTKGIRDVNRYIRKAMEAWFSDWTARYPTMDE